MLLHRGLLWGPLRRRIVSLHRLRWTLNCIGREKARCLVLAIKWVQLWPVTTLTSHVSLSPSSLFTPQNTGCYLTLQGCSVKKIGGLSSQRVHTNPPFIIWKKKSIGFYYQHVTWRKIWAHSVYLSASNVILTSTAHPTFVQHSKTQYYFRSNSSECSDTAGLPGLTYSDLTL